MDSTDSDLCDVSHGLGSEAELAQGLPMWPPLIVFQPVALTREAIS